MTWITRHSVADAVLSAKSNLVRAAKRAGLVAVQRFFLVDSFSYHQLPRVVEQARPDAIEILPGCMPWVITWLRDDTDVPAIAGGLVCDKAEVMLPSAPVPWRSRRRRRRLGHVARRRSCSFGNRGRQAYARPLAAGHPAAQDEPEGQVRRDVG